MTWSGFRPSDDACEYHYLIPANCFAAVILGELAAIAREAWQDEAFALEALRVRREIVQGIEAYGIVHHPRFGRIYAYEADGLGHFHLMDDANVPSLLSSPTLATSRRRIPFTKTRGHGFSARKILAISRGKLPAAWAASIPRRAMCGQLPLRCRG